MKQYDVFKDAKWVGGEVAERKDIFFLRGKFDVTSVKNATLYVIGLGYFHCYINGARVSDDLFLPLSTDYEVRPNYPTDEILTSHRIYVPNYDVKHLLKDGENEILIHFGGGWYTQKNERGFGDPKAIWRVFGEDENGEFDFGSSENDLVAKSYVDDYYFQMFERHDFTKTKLDWKNAILDKPVDTEYLFTDCPADGALEIIEPVKVKDFDGYAVYACPKNLTGYPVIEVYGEAGETARIEFSEEILEDGNLNQSFAHKQNFYVVCDGQTRTVKPLFTWYGFRYFAVFGKIRVKHVEFVHTKSAVLAEFESDNICLNWINDTFVNTQLCNMHSGIPSDCPHLERRGYTGDGQLTCHAVMNILDAESFYRKWIGDIRDCQDILTGHIQYTAPYIRSGGGPGGWGCAIVEVPFRFYQHYGDKTVLEDCYPQMLKYFDYLEAHTQNGLVVSDKAGEWCLGDWCTPEQITLPAPFVNNYFYIKSLMQAVEIAKIIGREEDIPMLEERCAQRKNALMAAYFNTFDGNFLGAAQGANAFAVDIGIGDRRTYENLVKYYEYAGYLDTGIFGTDVVTRVLFKHGDGELAGKLLTAQNEHSFDSMRKLGATTLWEYWPNTRRNWRIYDRSHNHPMFGAAAAYLYDYILGVRTIRNADATSKIVVSPVMTSTVNTLRGSRVIDGVRVSVSYTKENEKLYLCVKLSNNADAEFLWKGEKYALTIGENRFELDI